MQELSNNNIENSQIYLTTNAPVPYPQNGNYSEKKEFIDKVRILPPSEEQATILRNALTLETNQSFTSSLISSLLHHEGCENNDERGTHYQVDDIDRVYDQAIKTALNTQIRIALHHGYAEYRSLGSKDGLIASSRAEKLAKILNNTIDFDEQKVLISILRNRAAYNEETLLKIMNNWLNDKSRILTYDDINLWITTLRNVCKNETWHTKNIKAEARNSLINIFPNISDTKIKKQTIELLVTDLIDYECMKTFLKAIKDDTPEVRYIIVRNIGSIEEKDKRTSNQILYEAIKDDDSSVKAEATRYICKLGEEGKSIAIQILSSSKDSSIIYSAWEALSEYGESHELLLRYIANNPNTEASVKTVIEKIYRYGEKVFYKQNSFSKLWASFPSKFKDELNYQWKTNFRLFDYHFHRKYCFEFYHDVLYKHRDNPTVIASTMSWVKRPFYEIINAYDFESITGLHRDEPVNFYSSSFLRFGFLSRTKSFDEIELSDLRNIRNNNMPSLNELAEEELDFDRERDKLANLRKELVILAKYLSDESLEQLRREEFSRENIDKIIAEKKESFINLEKEVQKLEKELFSEQSEKFWNLRRASEQWKKHLSEVGCSFKGILSPDGVLGEYSPSDKSITLFPEMINLAVKDISRKIKLSTTEIEPLVRTIVELHELAHAHIHLGKDVCKGIWDNPEHGSHAYHESIAQIFTRRIVLSMNVPNLSKVLEQMELWLPKEYMIADTLEYFDTEELRSYIIKTRKILPKSKFEELFTCILKGLPSYLMLLNNQFEEQDWIGKSNLLDKLDFVLKAKNRDIYSAFTELFKSIEPLPNAKTIIGAFIPGGWPSEKEFYWILFEAQIQGQPVGKKPLRYIHKDDFIFAISQSQSSAEIGLQEVLKKCHADIIQLSSTQALNNRKKKQKRQREKA